MSRKRRVSLVISIVLALGSFAVGIVWLGRAKQDGWVVAHMYRDLPKLGDSRQASADLKSIARLEKKHIPYAYPLLFGFAFGLTALGIVAWPMKKNPALLLLGLCAALLLGCSKEPVPSVQQPAEPAPSKKQPT